MKTILMFVMVGFALSASAHADIVKTSSISVNPAFPKSVAEIMKIDEQSTSASRSMGSDEVGELMYYSCVANTDTSDNNEHNSIECTFKHALPEGMCWYGTYLVKYSQIGGENGAISVSQTWSREY